MIENGRKKQVLENLVEISFDGKVNPKFDKTNSLTERMAQYNVPGISIAVINDYKIAWTHVEGIIDNNSKKKVNENTIFEAASATKPFTAAAALHLVEKGILSLDGDVNDILKDWKIPENEFTKKEKVTLRRLLTHKAGINRPESMFNIEEGKVPTLIQVLKGETPAMHDPVEVIFEPGSDHQYSNFGYVIIEKLMEDATGKNYKELMKEIIFEPLGMKNSLFDVPLPDEKADNAIQHHIPTGETKGRGVSAGYYGHGGLQTTAEDIANFMVEIMKTYKGISEKILSQEMVRKYLSSEQKLDPTKYFGLFTDQALGFFLIDNGKDMFFILPGENSPGANCLVIGSHTQGKGACVMTNSAQGSLLSMEIVFSLVKEYQWNFG
ncbi:MAG: beta-lactamase family protein [Asgard group archaeon]|nr:beta-lactamase family protein [Asgard group archaeon]